MPGAREGSRLPGPIRGAAASLAALGLLLWPSAAGSAEPVKARSPEALWEISKNHLKDPFRWPSVWRSRPQAKEAADMAGWKEGKPALVKEEAGARPAQAAPDKPDWRAREEKRTMAYLAKVAPLHEAIIKPLPPAAAPADETAPSAPGLRYMASSLLLATPYIGFPGEGGAIYPGECRIQYSSANESAILQLYDEVVLDVGKNAGVKPGDLYRTYEVGAPYRSFSAGRNLGRLVETNGIVEITRVSARSSAGRLIRSFGTLSRDTRACPLTPLQEVTAAGYSPLPEARVSGQVVWVTQGQQLPQPYSFAVVDQGARKGFRLGDMVLFFNRNKGRMTDKVLGNGLVVNLQEESATILIQDIYPGIINRGDYSVAIQTPVL
jgi:hypothetical protein